MWVIMVFEFGFSKKLFSNLFVGTLRNCRWSKSLISFRVPSLLINSSSKTTSYSCNKNHRNITMLSNGRISQDPRRGCPKAGLIKLLFTCSVGVVTGAGISKYTVMWIEDIDRHAIVTDDAYNDFEDDQIWNCSFTIKTIAFKDYWINHVELPSFIYI